MDEACKLGRKILGRTSLAVMCICIHHSILYHLIKLANMLRVNFLYTSVA